MRFRGKSIRRKIVALLLVPLISVIALSALASVLTGSEALDLHHLRTAVDRVGDPVQDTIGAVQQERLDTLILLAAPRSAATAKQLDAERAVTDRAVAAVRAGATPGVRGGLDASSGRHLDSFLGALGRLDALRASVDENAVSRSKALGSYDGIVDPGYTFLSTVYGKEDVDRDNQGRALVGIDQAQEMFSRENAVVTAALVAGRLSVEERRSVSDLVANRKLLYASSLADLPTEEAAVLRSFNSGPSDMRLSASEDDIATTGAMVNDRTMSAQQWRDMTAFVVAGIAKESVQSDTFFRQHAASSRRAVYIRFAAAAAIGLIALLASVIVSVRVGRALIHDLSELRKEANEAAGVRLPSVMRRLAAGEQVDVETEAPRLDYERHEIGQVGQALNTLQRAAVEATVKQADLRRGVAEVFVNLARRNQVLLHRQLGLLDTMERRTEDTEELADLFRLDHLTTRMRRHAEGLVILSGAVPSRQWRKPVQLMDVVRAAVAEVEDYERIEVRRLPRIGVGGPAVADLTHLLAELLENATVFSPPHTAVQVTGDRVAGGFTLEIHDRGLGMPPEILLDANLRLAETPEFELSDTDRLGLFVVSRLAQRQNVRVSLQPSPYGGTTALVLLPAALLTDAPDTQTGFRLDRKDRAASDPARSRTDSGGIRLAALGARDDAAFGAATDAEVQHQQASEPLPELESDPPELPRRRPPTLVADRGRRLDEQQGRAHPVPQGERKDEARPPGGPAEPTAATSAVSDPPPAVQDAASTVANTPSAPRRKQRPPEPDSALGGLPRRVRQASLAPQLKEAAPERAAERNPEKDKDQDAERDADAVRDRMASLQKGWQRGRRQNEAEDDAGHPGGTQGTTSEGDGR